MIGKQLSSLRLPDFITLLGLCSSLTAVFLLLRGSAFILPAYLAILGQLLADFLDGRIARASRKESALGVYLDSFSDFFTIFATILFGKTLGMSGALSIAVFAFVLLAAALRLSYFTVHSGGKSRYFTGLPTTAVSFIIPTVLFLNHLYFHVEINYYLSLYFVCGLLMISSLRIRKL